MSSILNIEKFIFYGSSWILLNDTYGALALKDVWHRVVRLRTRVLIPLITRHDKKK